jgi:hypothetical protein
MKKRQVGKWRNNGVNKKIIFLQIKTKALVMAGFFAISFMNVVAFGLPRGGLILLSVLSGLFIYAAYTAPRMRVLVLLEMLDICKSSDDPELRYRAKIIQEKLEGEGHVLPKE